jgi:hypothetical protein
VKVVVVWRSGRAGIETVRSSCRGVAGGACGPCGAGGGAGGLGGTGGTGGAGGSGGQCCGTGFGRGGTSGLGGSWFLAARIRGNAGNRFTSLHSGKLYFCDEIRASLFVQKNCLLFLDSQSL